MDHCPPAAEGAADLCTDCALCCGGALFDTVPMAEGEAESVAALGLDVVRREREAARFHLLMTALNRFLDRHFRPEGQRQVVQSAERGSPARRGDPHKNR